MSVDAADCYGEDGKTQVRRVGGRQLVGKPKECSFVLNCMPAKTFGHHLKPTKIPGEPQLVLLGIDFLSKFDEFTIDWTSI